MHNNEPTATLLQVLRDLSRTIEQMAPEQSLTAIERDMLLAEMQQLYAQILQWPVAAPKKVEVAPAAAPFVANVPDSKFDEAAVAAVAAPETQATALEEQVEALTGEVMEQLVDVVEEAVEEAMETGKEVEFDIQLQVSEKEKAPAEDGVAEVAEREEVAAGVADLAMEAQANTDVMEEIPVAASAPVAVSQAQRSVAFSLSGVLQQSGDSQLVMAHLKLKPIDDLKSGIGLNEKFLFMRELFNNDHLAYADAIEQLNASNSLAEAEKIIADKLLPAYQWDLETEAAVSFLHLIFRRFAPNV